MATRSDIKLAVQSRDNRDLPLTQASITVVEWDKQDRTRNALRTLGMILLATFVSIFVPILHWVLAPSLFIASFVLALDKLGEKSRSQGGKGECPKCHQQFTVQASKLDGRITNNCEHCHEDLEMIMPASVISP